MKASEALNRLAQLPQFQESKTGKSGLVWRVLNLETNVGYTGRFTADRQVDDEQGLQSFGNASAGGGSEAILDEKLRALVEYFERRAAR